MKSFRRTIPWLLVWALLPGLSVAQVAQQCAACHGGHGEGSADMGTPRIAGQSQAYLQRQLEAYANGARKNAVMAEIAKALSAEQRKEVAAHYAQLTAPTRPASHRRASARARTLVTKGDQKRGVPPCESCHGRGGIGLAPAPYLAGQVTNYLKAALAEWKSGARKTDPTGQMPHVAQKLSETDMRALAQYFGALPAPQAAGRAAMGADASGSGTGGTQ
jgi:cytochrome c553